MPLRYPMWQPRMVEGMLLHGQSFKHMRRIEKPSPDPIGNFIVHDCAVEICVTFKKKDTPISILGYSEKLSLFPAMNEVKIISQYGTENITRLRRFAVGIIKSKGPRGEAQKMRLLTRNVRSVFDYIQV